MPSLKTPSKIGTSAAWLNKAGIYHVNVISVDGQPKAGEGFEPLFGVLQGEEEKKQFSIMLFNPSESGTQKQQEEAAGKQTAMLIGTGICTEQQLGTEVNYEYEDMVNRQAIVEVYMSEPKNPGDKSFVRLSYDRIYHVDDPRVAHVPKNVAALKLLPPSMRRDPKSFDLTKLGGSPAAAAPTANGKTASANGNGKAAAAATNLDDVLDGM